MVLQNLLDTLMKDNTISSWNIRGEGEMTHVNIRFTNNKMADDNVNIAYKKIPPSRQTRDQKRMSEWKHVSQQQVLHNDDKCSVSKGSDNIKDEAMTNRDQGLSIQSKGTSHDQTSTTSKNRRDSPTIRATAQVTNPSITPKGQAPASAVQPNHFSDQHSRPSTSHVNSMVPVNSNVDNDDITDFDDFEVCRGCTSVLDQEDPSQMLYQCLVCEDYFICAACKELNHHGEHKGTLIKLTKNQYQRIIDMSHY